MTNEPPIDREHVDRWAALYESGWRALDRSVVERLFTDDIKYRRSPYEEPLVGHAAVKDFWTVDGDAPFTMTSSIVAVEDHTAVVRVEVRYGPPTKHEYRDLWVLRFAPDGRVDDFEEWAYWPGRGYTAASD